MPNQRALVAFYLHSGTRELIPIYPLYAVMMGEHGIGALALSTLFSIWALVGVVTEVPSGALADAWSRKQLVVLSGITKALAFYTWYAFQDFTGYALGFILWGLGSSLRSGAWEALLHDVLKQRGEQGRFTRHYGRINAVGTTAVVLGELAGGALIIHGYDTVLLVSMAMPLIASAIFAGLVSEPPRDETVSEPGYLAMLSNGFAEAIGNRAILYVFIVFTFLATASGIFDEYVNPVLFEQGFSLAMVAYLSAGIALAAAAGEASAGYFEALTLDQLLLVMLAGVLLLLVLMPFGGLWTAIAMGLFFAVFDLGNTLFAGQLQDEIEGAARATVTSIVSVGDGAGAVMWFMAYGLLAERVGMTGAASGFAVATIALCLMLRYLGRAWQITRRTGERQSDQTG